MKRFITLVALPLLSTWFLTGCDSGSDCVSHATVFCTDGVNYWMDSCGNFEEVIEQCATGCKADQTGCEGDSTACDEPDDCPAGQGCVSGICGSCQDETNCRTGEACNNGFCTIACTSGPCCDNGVYRSVAYECASWTEYRCTGTQCGADAQSRTVRQNCSGVSPTCDGQVFGGLWVYKERCENNAVCFANDSDAGCTNCSVICKDGACAACTDEPCCDDGSIATAGTSCDSSWEYRCEPANECGADAQQRSVTRVCDGSSVECTGDITEGNWSTRDECTPDEVCWADAVGAGCTTCSDGCENGACNEPCTAGPCCDNGSLRDSSYECASWTEYQCSGEACGDDAQERLVTQNCSGFSQECDGTISENDWTTITDCGIDDLCQADEFGAECITCDLGCSGDTCNPCTDEPCCDNGSVRPSDFQCDSWTEYRCNGNICGSDAQQRQITQFCDGISALCNGSTVEDSWSTIDVCHAEDMCMTDGQTYAECLFCDNGCANGQCNP